MCVLTYIPTEEKGFILTSNRDEAVAREMATPPRKYTINGHQVFFPKDPRGGGTWIASNRETTLCLLNGGIVRHIPQPPYRQSRGKVILDFFKYMTVKTFIDDYNFTGIEPFTLVIIESVSKLIIHELKWDGTQLFNKKKDTTKPHIWSSVTLYSPEIIEKREQWFSDFLQQPINPEKVLDFHQYAGVGDIRNDIRINRDNVLKTLSTTQYVISKKLFTIYYEDLVTQKKYNYRVID
jgi:hypothetical protein